MGPRLYFNAFFLKDTDVVQGLGVRGYGLGTIYMGF